MNTHTYLFYDLETSGLNKCFDQVLQFAAIRTDLQLQELERHEILLQLNNDTVPSPYATITHGISIQQCANGMREIEAIRRIHDLFNRPGTISVGYNNLNFDDEFLRFSFYRNLLSPYTHQFANQCARMDIYPITLLYYLFKPEALIWPIVNNKPSMKLENINTSNQMVHGQAHNALVDVEITLALAKRLQRYPDMWQYAISYFNKAFDQQRLEKLTHQEINGQIYPQALIIDGSIGADNHYQAPVLGLGQHHHYKNQYLWLRLDNVINEQSWVYRKKMGENFLLLPWQPRFLRHLDAQRQQITHNNIEWLGHHPEILQQIAHYHREYTYPKIPHLDVDAALYELNFPTPHEEFLFQRFHLAPAPEKSAIAAQFPNPIRREQAIRLLGRHFSQYCTSHDKKIYQDYIDSFAAKTSSKLADYRGEMKMTPMQALQQITTIKQQQVLTSKQQELLDELEEYLTC